MGEQDNGTGNGTEQFKDPELEKEANPEVEGTTAGSGSTDNVGEASVEFDVEELIAELEADSGPQSNSTEASARKRLEEVLEKRRVAHELEELDEFDSAGAD